MNRVNLTGKGFADIPYEELNKNHLENIFKTWNIKSKKDVYLLNLHTGTNLGYVEEQGSLLATNRWMKDQEDVGTTLVLAGVSSTGDILEEGASGKMVSFLLFKNSQWYTLSFNKYSNLYEFILVTLDEVNLPEKIPEEAIFYVHQVLPHADKNIDLRYGDFVVLENKLTGGYLSKGEKDGCTLSEYPFLSDHKMGDFSSELVTSFIQNKGPMYCKSAECEDLTDNNKKYGEYSGCTMLYWQILPVSEDWLVPQSAKIKLKPAYNTNPEVFLWALIPFFFIFILFLLILFYYYF